MNYHIKKNQQFIIVYFNTQNSYKINNLLNKIYLYNKVLHFLFIRKLKIIFNSLKLINPQKLFNLKTIVYQIMLY